MWFWTCSFVLLNSSLGDTGNAFEMESNWGVATSCLDTMIGGRVTRGTARWGEPPDPEVCWARIEAKQLDQSSSYHAFTLQLLQEPFCDFFGPLGVNRLVHQLSPPWELIGERKGTRWFWGWVVIRSVDADPPWLTNTPLSQPHLLSQLPRTLPFMNSGDLVNGHRGHY